MLTYFVESMEALSNFRFCLSFCLLECIMVVVSVEPHSQIKGNVESLLQLTPWNWQHLNTSVKVDSPVSVDVSLISHYRLTGKHLAKYLLLQKQRDCASILKRIPNTKGRDGVYTIYPDLKTRKLVYCDMTTDGGGWTVIQRRIDGVVDFNRDWKSYKEGFGKTEGEYWLGNDVLHILTLRRKYELRVDLETFSGAKGYAKYSTFTVGSESQKYKLTVTGYEGDAGDSLSYHSGRAFSTVDQDNDAWSKSCAVDRLGAWWFGACEKSLLNGPYRHSAMKSPVSINWEKFKNGGELALKSARMMIRPKV